MSYQTCIGVIGGFSWHASAAYYRHLNVLVAQRLGGKHSARVLLHSVDFEDIVALERVGRWDEVGRLLADEARTLEAAGAGSVLIAANSMHAVAAVVEASITVPFLHVADAIAYECEIRGCRRVGLLGTRPTMSMPFLVDALAIRGIVAIQPRPNLHDRFDLMIHGDLSDGVFEEPSRALLGGTARELADQGCDAVVLACSELAALWRTMDILEIPSIDAALAHCSLAVERAIDDHLLDGALR